MGNIEHFSDKAYRIATTIVIELLKYQSYVPKSNTAANKKIYILSSKYNSFGTNDKYII